jgi:hypothetical protein
MSKRQGIPVAAWRSRADAFRWFEREHGDALRAFEREYEREYEHKITLSAGTAAPAPLTGLHLNAFLSSQAKEDRETSEEVAAALFNVERDLKAVMRKLRQRFAVDDGYTIPVIDDFGSAAEALLAQVPAMTEVFGRDGALYAKAPVLANGQTATSRMDFIKDANVVWWVLNCARAPLESATAALASIAIGREAPCEGAEHTARIDRWRKRLAPLRGKSFSAIGAGSTGEASLSDTMRRHETNKLVRSSSAAAAREADAAAPYPRRKAARGRRLN